MVELKSVAPALVIVSIAIAALLQNVLTPPPAAVVGIDLGTTHSCVGVFINGEGTVKIIPDEQGRPLLPSIVGFTSDGTVVGYEARKQQSENAANTIFDAKRFIGKRFDDASLQADLPLFPYHVVDVDGAPHFRVSQGQGTRLVTPHRIGGYLLDALRLRAQEYLAREVSGAVLAVPVEFTRAQRDATRDAGAACGLEILRIISEPTAAAIAYGLQDHQDASLIIVYDFGGGTLDVSLLHVSFKVFEVLATSGDEHLGGEDFNTALLLHMQSLLLEAGVDVSNHSLHMQVLRDEVERVKRVLSVHQEATLSIEGVLPNRKDFSTTIGREQFEQICRGVFLRLLAPVQDVLSRVSVSPADVDEVVLVGGSTRVPRVRSMLREYFGKQPNTSIDPEQAVAIGTAIQAGIITDAWPVPVAAVEKPYDPTRGTAHDGEP